jgi:hypothetical protein
MCPRIRRIDRDKPSAILSHGFHNEIHGGSFFLFYMLWRLCMSLVLPIDGREIIKIFTSKIFMLVREIFIKKNLFNGTVL